MTRPYILMALPCFNEAENLPALLRHFVGLNRLYGANFEVKVIVIDDCSKDNTQEVMKNLEIDLDVRLVTHPQNRGLMGGINTAFDEFYKNSKEENPAIAYALMDGDNTHSPYHLPGMLERNLQGFDVVIASRYRAGSRVCGVSWWRQLLSFGVAFLFRVLRNVQGVLDYSCGYRLYSPRIVTLLKERLPEDVVREKSFACMVELLVKCSILGARCTEVPILLRYDMKLGESKMPFRKTIVGTFKLLLTLWKVRV
jgi:dolichol-phosphate mannosyltransferase